MPINNRYLVIEVTLKIMPCLEIAIIVFCVNSKSRFKILGIILYLGTYLTELQQNCKVNFFGLFLKIPCFFRHLNKNFKK